MVNLLRSVGIITIACLVMGVPAMAANLVQDPGFEFSTGTAPGYNGFSSAWITSSPTFNCTIFSGQADLSSPCWDPGAGNATGQTASTYIHTGNWGTFLGNPFEGQSSLYQVVSLDPGVYNFSFYWRHNLSYAPNPPADPQLGTLDAFIGSMTGNVPNWSGGVNVITDPQGTTPWALFTLQNFTVSATGNYFIGWRWDSVFGDYAIDDVNLETAVPEPSTLLLTLAPLAAGMLYRRRKKS
jgi:hypothetical protein